MKSLSTVVGSGDLFSPCHTETHVSHMSEPSQSLHRLLHLRQSFEHSSFTPSVGLKAAAEWKLHPFCCSLLSGFCTSCRFQGQGQGQMWLPFLSRQMDIYFLLIKSKLFNGGITNLYVRKENMLFTGLSWTSWSLLCWTSHLNDLEYFAAVFLHLVAALPFLEASHAIKWTFHALLLLFYINQSENHIQRAMSSATVIALDLMLRPPWQRI